MGRGGSWCSTMRASRAGSARRRRRLRAEPALEARIVEHHEPPLPIGREARAADEMVEADSDRRQASDAREPVDAVPVLLSEEEISRLRIDGEAAQDGLSRPLGER